MATTRHTITLRVRAPLEPADLPGLSERVCAVFAATPGCVVRCDVDGVTATAVTVEALARLQLVARRSGCLLTLWRPSDDLRALIELMGMTDVVPEQR